jgi:WD40 repeat protein
MPGALPLLSFALSELYLKYLKRQEDAKNQGETIDRAITQADYQELGGVTRSLTQRADQEYEALVNQDPAYAQTIRHVMLRMVAVEGELARRRVPLSELEYPKSENIRVQAVIKHFEDTRLLTTDKDPEGQPYVEPAHDVLVRGWKRFLDWKQKEQENLILQRRLTPAAEDWSSHQQAKFLWNANPRLDLLKKTLKSKDNWFNQVEAEFVRHSLTKRLSNTIIRWSIASGIVIAAIGAALFFNRLRLIEEKNRVNAEIGVNSATAERVFTSNELDGLIAILKVVQSLEQEGNKISPVTRMRVVITLQKIIYGIKQSNQLKGSGSSPAFSPDGQTIAIPNNGKVQLLKSSGEKILEFGQLGEGWGDIIAFSPDSQKIAILATGNTIKIYDLQGQELKTLRLKDIALDGLCELAFKSDGHTITIACHNIVTFWDLKTNKHLSLKTIEGDSIAVSPDGQTIATCVGNTVKLWNLQGKELQTLKGHSSPVWSIAFSPDGQTIATASLDHTAKLWNLKGKELVTLKGHRYWVKKVAFSPDGHTIATASQDRTIKLWNLQGQQLQTFSGYTSWVDNVTFSPNGQILTSISSGNGNIMFWNLKGETLQKFKLSGVAVNSVVFNSENQTLFLAREDGVKILNLQGKPLRKLSSNFSNVAISPDGHTIATFGGNNTVKLRNLEGEEIETLSMNWECNFRSSVDDVAFSPDGQTLATSCTEGSVKVWNLKTKKELNTLPGHHGRFGLDTPTKKLVFSPDGQMIASTTVDGSVKLWNWQKNTVKTISGHSEVVKSIAFSPDSQFLATASQDRTIKLWNLKGEELQTLRGHGQAVNSVTFSPDSQILFSGSEDSTVKIWSLQGEQLQTFTEHNQAIASLALSPDGQTLVSASVDNEVIVWNLSLNNLMLRSCNWLQAYFITHPKTLSELRMCVTESQFRDNRQPISQR